LLEPGCACIEDAGGDDSRDDMLLDTMVPFCYSSIGTAITGDSILAVKLRCLELAMLIVIS